jgi:mRNA interferase MazF
VNYSKGDVILLSYPFTDQKTQKVRPAAVVSKDTGKYNDIFIIPLTSRVNNLSDSEFCLSNWKAAGLNVPTAAKRGCILIDTTLVIKKIGVLVELDIKQINDALKNWLDLN